MLFFTTQILGCFSGQKRPPNTHKQRKSTKRVKPSSQNRSALKNHGYFCAFSVLD